MDLWFKIAFLVAAVLNFGVQAVYFTHMLQLNSYRPERYKKWCVDNDKKLVTVPRMLPFLCVLALWLAGRVQDWILYGVCAAVLLLTALLCWPQKAKKPLVITARVKRVFITQAVLCIGLLCLIFLPAYRGVALIGVANMIVWLWTGVANLINTPIENTIAKGYVKDAAKRLSAMPNLTVVGVTGSYGKTSVKNYLNALLSAKYNVLMTPGSYNTTMGVVRTIREMLRPSHEIFIAEMGAKQKNDIKEICDLVHPTYGIVTSIGEQHLETFGSIDNIIATKFELADAIPATGAAILNYDNEYIRARGVAVPTVTYGGADSGAGYRYSDMAVDTHGCQFTLTAPDGERCRYTTHLLGGHNIQNLAGCMALAHTLGISLKEMVYPVRLIKTVEHRLQLLPNGYIDDAYNSNPAGFRSALDTLAAFRAQRVLVTPGMVELGERQDALNRELGEYAATRCDYAVLVGIKQAPPLKEGLLAGGFPEERIFVAATLQEGLQFVNNLPCEGERIVLLENDLPDNF
ncbi:MAG: UDP-N-acetylmuramoyl-tripeptide--D-alanyl-D-alanine ligase [Clostridia bacterium]|nr:UDP-N-acetylmuramoyl-tripeptide--D-alanyl-D-alanine ligase [Clostridia bacterium]